ncbi:hypothetical protein [Parafrankia discariae]|uniref:hypothetical protein n=1 Tax=Parafrankia discariae TaxID=365528 RepID=UPI0003712E35|nr:hypothetical protein [Parafrankia discariae]
MADIRVESKLPDWSENGIEIIRRRLVEEEEANFYAVIRFDCSKVTTTRDTGEVTPTIRIRAFEPIGTTMDGAADEDAARRLLETACEQRTIARDADPDDDPNSMFSGVDPITGEIRKPPTDG